MDDRIPSATYSMPLLLISILRLSISTLYFYKTLDSVKSYSYSVNLCTTVVLFFFLVLLVFCTAQTIMAVLGVRVWGLSHCPLGETCQHKRSSLSWQIWFSQVRRNHYPHMNECYLGCVLGDGDGRRREKS